MDFTQKNINAAGQDRVNVQEADESALTGVPGITPSIARAIIAYRGQNQFQSVADLLDVTAPQPAQNLAGNQRNGRNPGNSASQNPAQPSPGGGPKVIDENLFSEIADDVSVGSTSDSPGLININTAGLDVLATLPGSIANSRRQSFRTADRAGSFRTSVGC